MEKEEIEKKIIEILDDHIDVPNYSYFVNYKKNISDLDCYNALVDELYKLIKN